MTTFTALVLDKPSRELLLRFVRPEHGQVFADHVTLAVEPLVPVASEFKAFCRVVAHRSDGKGQAVDVMVDDRAGAYLDGERRTHVTVSCAKGTAPAYSSEIAGGSEPLGFSLVLTGPVKTVTPRS